MKMTVFRDLYLDTAENQCIRLQNNATYEYTWFSAYVPLLRSISLPPGMFNADTLARYDGKTGSKGLYLALLGKVI